MKTLLNNISQGLAAAALGMMILTGCASDDAQPAGTPTSQRPEIINPAGNDVILFDAGFEAAPGDETDPAQQAAQAFRAVDQTGDTRTSIDGLSTKWVAGDKIGVFSDNARIADVGEDTGDVSSPYKVVNFPLTAVSNNGASAFSGTMYWKNNSSDHVFYAYYPHSATDAAKSAVPIEVKPVQNQTAGSNPAHVSDHDFLIAHETTVNPDPIWGGTPDNKVHFSFKRVFCMIEFRIKGSGNISRVNLSSADANDVLAFTGATISLTPSAPASGSNYTIPLAGTGVVKYKSVILNVPSTALTSPASYADAKKFYMVINPSDLTGKSLDIRMTIDGQVKRLSKTGINFLRGKKYVVNIDASTAENLIGSEVLIEKSALGDMAAKIDACGTARADITNLKITGPMNANDFTQLGVANLPNLAQIDLGGVTALPTVGIGQNRKPNAIPSSIFTSNTSLQIVILPSLASMQNLADGAFGNCTNLYSVSTPGVSDSMFPSTLLGIGTNAFVGCVSLTGTLNFPASLTGIGISAFEDCGSLTGPLTIGNAIASVGAMAFKGCTGLTGALNITYSGITIGANAFNGCTGFSSLTLPDSVGGSGNGIGASAFFGCKNLAGTLTLPSDITRINNNTFYGCEKLGLVSGTPTMLNIPASTELVGERAFEGCKGFSGLTFQATSAIRTIGNMAFKNCSSFAGALTIPNGINTIGDEAFVGCGFTGALTIGNFGTHTYESDINIQISAIGGSAFLNCRFSSLSIGTDLKVINTMAFRGCNLISGTLTLPSTLTDISRYAFYNCSGLSGTCTIPSTVIDLKAYAFYGTGITTFNVPWTTSAAIPTLEAGLQTFPSGAQVKIPGSSYQSYYLSKNWPGDGGATLTW
ncbi:hypothetical protein FACS1894159_05280 [Bacteroidia bacterium]|nr:hypothetical protein FACS1894159_05280 [Bacteroidia bacterium]